MNKIIKVFHFLRKFVIFKIHDLKIKLSLNQFLYFSAFLIGIMIASLVIGLKWVINFIHQFLFVEKHAKSTILWIFLPMLGFLLTTVLVHKIFGKQGYKQGLSNILLAISQKKSNIPPIEIIAQLLTCGITIGLGGSLGIESPSVVAGSSLGSNYALTYKIRQKNQTLLLCCGVAASISAAFFAPIAGVLFAIEIMTLEVSTSAFLYILIASASASLLNLIIFEDPLIFNVNPYEIFSYHDLGYFIFLGIFCGYISVYYAKVFEKTNSFFKQYQLSLFSKSIICGGFYAMILLLFPAFFGDGYHTIKSISNLDFESIFQFSFLKNEMNGWILILLIFALVLFKPIVAGLAIAGGGNGGNFAPSLFMGACLGCCMGLCINQFVDNPVLISQMALLGMAGVLAGLYHAPLTALFLIIEISHGYQFIIPLMFVVAISYGISKFIEPYPIEFKKYIQEGQIFGKDKIKNILSNVSLLSIMKKPSVSFERNDNFEDTKALIFQSHERIIPILEKKGELFGVFYIQDITDINSNPVLEDLVQQDIPSIYCNETTYKALNILDTDNQIALAVLDLNQKFIGFVYKIDILDAIRTNLSISQI